MKQVFYKKAFTLPEVMVAIAVIALVVVAATNLVVSIIRSNSENINRLLAYGLAQEGLEAVRNMRDSDWLLGAKFTGELGKANSAIWGETFPGNGEDPKYFTVDLKTLDTSTSVGINQVSLVSSVAPWELSDITQSGAKDEDYAVSNDTLLYKYEEAFQNQGEVHYSHEQAPDSTATLFHRFVRIEAIPYEVQSGQPQQDFMKMRVMSVVSWQEFGRSKEVRLDTELTDWKEGAV